MYDNAIKSVVFKSEPGPSLKDKTAADQFKEQYGDTMQDFLWDGPEDSDEEIEELALFKNDFEKTQKIVFSKKGIKKYI